MAGTRRGSRRTWAWTVAALTAAGCAGDPSPEPRAGTPVHEARAAEGLPPLEPAEEVVAPDVRTLRRMDEEERIIEQPVLRDAKIESRNETDDTMETEKPLGDPRFNSDRPFQGQGTNANVGIGGGAGGAFGGRRGGQRNLRAHGGGVAAGAGPVRGADLPQSEPSSTDSFEHREDNPFRRAAASPLSTFSVDVDTASYSIVRRALVEGALPPRGAVRLEEMVNYFPYAYPAPDGAAPFSVSVAAGACPWEPAHRLVRIGLRGRSSDEGTRPAANLVFLVDVSGSMQEPDRLPLLVKSLRLLAERLQERDRVAIVVYAGSSGLVLPSTPGSSRGAVLDALDRLWAGGSTNGGEGIRLAYSVAKENRIERGINRVILCTDGDFNVGTTSRSDLVDLVRAGARDGTFLTVLGFGSGNLKDDTLEAIADKGNGNYAYIDSLAEGRRVLAEQAGGTLETIAKDVKIQVEFNPGRVAGYRLLGYENRMLAAEDFANDRKDAGEIGAGHRVTALYEIVPAGGDVPAGAVEELRYGGRTEGGVSAEMLTVRLRWKEPDGDASTPAEFPFTDAGLGWAEADGDFRFAAGVACFAMVLRGADHRGTASFDTVRELCRDAAGDDPDGSRREFLGLVERAAALPARDAAGTR